MTRVLVSVAILEGESVSAGLIDLLSTVDVTVLGYHVLPEQTPPDQARAQFEDRAVAALEDLSEEFAEAGGEADHRLVFTHDREQSVRRVAADVEADAWAITGATGDVDRLLVPVSGAVAVDRIISFVASLVGNREIGVTLLLASEEESADGTLADAADELREAGIDVSTREATESPLDAIVEAIPGHDAVVMGERAPSLSSFLFGDEADRVAAASVGPVLVVRGPKEGSAD